MKPSFDWPALVEKASNGDVGPLVAATQHLAAWHRAYKWPMTAEDFPPELLAYLVEADAPTGRPGRKPRSKFRQAELRHIFETMRVTVEAFRAGHTHLNLIDRHSKIFEAELTRDSGYKATPADVALEYLGHQNNLSSNTVRDMVYPRGRRKLKTTTKSD